MVKRVKNLGFLFNGLLLLAASVVIIAFLPLGVDAKAQIAVINAPTNSLHYLPIIAGPQNTATPTKTSTPTPTQTPTSTATPTPTKTLTPGPIPIGPFGGTFTAIVVDPLQPAIVYAGSFTNGVYKSIDRGITWYRMVNGLGELSIQSLAIHPNNSAVIYAGTYTGGLYKSTNSAASWIKVGNSSFGNHIVYDIAIDQTNPNIVLITTRTKFSPTLDPLVGYLWRSADGGNTWQLLRLGNDFATPDYFYDVSIHPTDGSRVFLSYHEHGFFRSDDGGFTFSAYNVGATDLTARSVAFDSMVNALVYAGTWNSPSAYRSDNAGRNWVPIQPVNVTNEVKTMKVVLVPFGSTYKQVLLATFSNGILSSVDRGSNWTRKGPGDIFINDIGVADSAYQYWFAAAQDLGVYRSVNAGSTWTNSRNNFTNVTITGSVESITAPGTILVSTIGQGVLRYDGEYWTELNNGLRVKDVTSLVSSGENVFATTTEGLYELAGDFWHSIALPVSEVSTYEKYLDEIGEHTLLQEEQVIETSLEKELSISAMVEPSYPIPLISFAEVNGEYFGGTAGFGLWCGDGGNWSRCGFENENVTVLKPLSGGLGAGVVVCDNADNCRLEVNRQLGWSEVNLGGFTGKINDFLEVNGSFWLATEKGLYLILPGSGLLSIPQVTGEIFSITADNEKSCITAVAGVGAVYTSADCGSTWNQWALGDADEQIKVAIADPKQPGQWLAGSLRSGVYRVNADQ